MRITTDDAFRVMDLGCGWGSVTLWFAQRFPKCTFVGVSNSKTQRQYILAEAKKRGLERKYTIEQLRDGLYAVAAAIPLDRLSNLDPGPTPMCPGPRGNPRC